MTSNSTRTNPYFCTSVWPLDVPRVHLIIFGIAQAVSFPFTIAANSTLIYALYKTGQLKKISNKFIFMMTISDLCIGAVGQPMLIIMVGIKGILRSCILEKVVEYVIVLSGNFSGFMLFCICVDRYLQVTKLKRYSEYMNQYRMRAAIIASFVLSNSAAVILLAVPSFTLQIPFTASYAIMIIFVASLYAYMMRHLTKHSENMAAKNANKRKIRRRNSIAQGTPNIYPVQMQENANKESNRPNEPRTNHLSALKTMRVLIIAVFVLYGPYNIASIYWAYYKFGKRAEPAAELSLFMLWSWYVVLTNAAINACIIINGNSRTRRFVLSKLQRSQSGAEA